MFRFRRCFAFAILALLCGCAFDVVRVRQDAAVFSPDPSALPGEYVLNNELRVFIGTGFPTVLKAGTHWHCVGRIAQGFVLSTKDQVVTVEASNIHEAQVVISERNLVGFFLPVEVKFTPAKNPVLFDSTPTLPITPNP